jgi:hypothetical protein
MVSARDAISLLLVPPRFPAKPVTTRLLAISIAHSHTTLTPLTPCFYVCDGVCLQVLTFFAYIEAA